MSWSSLLAARVITSGGRLQSEAGTERGEVGASSAEGTPGCSPRIWGDEQSPQSKEKGSLGQSPLCQEAVLLQGPRVPSPSTLSSGLTTLRSGPLLSLAMPGQVADPQG